MSSFSAQCLEGLFHFFFIFFLNLRIKWTVNVGKLKVQIRAGLCRCWREDSSISCKVLSLTWGQWPFLPFKGKDLPLLPTLRICSSQLHGLQSKVSASWCRPWLSLFAMTGDRETPTFLVIPNQQTLVCLSEHSSYFRDILVEDVGRQPAQGPPPAGPMPPCLTACVHFCYRIRGISLFSKRLSSHFAFCFPGYEFVRWNYLLSYQ